MTWFRWLFKRALLATRGVLLLALAGSAGAGESASDADTLLDHTIRQLAEVSTGRASQPSVHTLVGRLQDLAPEVRRSAFARLRRSGLDGRERDRGAVRQAAQLLDAACGRFGASGHFKVGDLRLFGGVVVYWPHPRPFSSGTELTWSSLSLKDVSARAHTGRGDLSAALLALRTNPSAHSDSVVASLGAWVSEALQPHEIVALFRRSAESGPSALVRVASVALACSRTDVCDREARRWLGSAVSSPHVRARVLPLLFGCASAGRAEFFELAEPLLRRGDRRKVAPETLLTAIARRVAIGAAELSDDDLLDLYLASSARRCEHLDRVRAARVIVGSDRLDASSKQDALERLLWPESVYADPLSFERRLTGDRSTVETFGPLNAARSAASFLAELDSGVLSVLPGPPSLIMPNERVHCDGVQGGVRAAARLRSTTLEYVVENRRSIPLYVNRLAWKWVTRVIRTREGAREVRLTIGRVLGGARLLAARDAFSAIRPGARIAMTLKIGSIRATDVLVVDYRDDFECDGTLDGAVLASIESIHVARE